MAGNEESVFAKALELQNAQERSAYLAQACAGDPGLRKNVDSLLAAYESGEFLESPAKAPIETVEEPKRECVGTVIGPYRLLEQIGEGGMGTVYLAQQTEPFERRVALKVIKPGMDSRQVIVRFEAERQALALMDHPNIAKVHDAGTAPDGRPFFVMELVKGVPITRYCDEHKLRPRQRLELFLPVCQAIQHAHQKGIIHRDIKPSNVLVALYDDKPVPKVIDFGVAKATGQQLTEQTFNTGFGAVVGTVEYMSPEQAGFNQLDVDTRSDVYSLGVLLYELLAGSPPFSRKELEKAGLLEMLRVIREQEPPRPSTKLSTAEGLPGLAASRGTEPKRLTALIRGELDWIVMKALEKDRARRYETANGFALDLQRYLADEPVQACPPLAGYRLRKFVRRNKAALTMGSVVAFAALFVVGSLGWTIRDRTARHAETATRIDSTLQETTRLRDDKNWSEARAAAQRASLLLTGGEDHPGLRRRLQNLVTDLDMVDRLERVRDDQPMKTDEFWDYISADAAYEASFREYGIDVMSLDHAAAAERVRASAISEELVLALDDWAWAVRGNPSRREPVRAIACLADPDPWRVRFRDPSVQRDRLALEKLAGQPETTRQPPSTIVYLGRALHFTGATSRAIEVLAGAQRLHPEHFWLNMYLASWLRWHTQPPRYDEATGYCRAAVAIRPQAPRAHLELGGCLRRPGHEDKAIAAFRRALELQPAYAHPYHSIGQALAMKGDWPAAIEAFQTCLRGKISPRLAVSVHRDIAAACRSIGACDKAITHYREAARLMPTDVLAHRELAFLLGNCADQKLRDPAQALESAKTAVGLAPQDALTWFVLGAARFRMGDWDGGIAALKKADKGLQSGQPYVWIFLAMAYGKKGAQEQEQARAWYDRTVHCMQERRKWVEGEPIAKEELTRLRAEAAELLGIEAEAVPQLNKK